MKIERFFLYLGICSVVYFIAITITGTSGIYYNGTDVGFIVADICLYTSIFVLLLTAMTKLIRIKNKK